MRLRRRGIDFHGAGRRRFECGALRSHRIEIRGAPEFQGRLEAGCRGGPHLDQRPLSSVVGLRLPDGEPPSQRARHAAREQQGRARDRQHEPPLRRLLPQDVAEPRARRGHGIAREPPVEIVGQRAHRRVSPRRVLLHRLQHDGLEIGGHFRVERTRQRRLVLNDGDERVVDGRRLERRPSREHRVERRAHRVDVGARVHAPALRLLGRHETRRADHHAGDREIGRLHAPREAEVHDIDAAVLDHQVLGLEIAVDHALLVRGLDRARRVADEWDASPPRSAKGRPVDELHRDERAAFMSARFVDSRDVRMIQPARDLRLALEAGDFVVVARRRREGGALQEFQRDPAEELDVVGLPDLAHAPGAQLPREDEFAGVRGRRGGCDLGGKRRPGRLDSRHAVTSEVPQPPCRRSRRSKGRA